MKTIEKYNENNKKNIDTDCQNFIIFFFQIRIRNKSSLSVNQIY